MDRWNFYPTIEIEGLTAEELKDLVIDEVESLGFELSNGLLNPRADDKGFQRGLHSAAREIELEKAHGWIIRAWKRY